MTLPKAILFDLDDTILSFSDASELAWKKCCEDFVASNVVDFNSETLLSRVNETRKWYWSDEKRSKRGRENMINARREVFSHALEPFQFTDSVKIYETADKYSKLQEALWNLFEGVIEALETIKTLNIRRAVVTNGTSKTQRGKLERFNITDYFEQIIIDTEVGFSKPDINIYKIALEKMKLSPEEVWMIGDNLVWDIAAPQKLGIYSVWNDFKKEGLPINQNIIPDKTVTSIYELSQSLT